MLYLYIPEDGDIHCCEGMPTEHDLKCVDYGNLSILKLPGSNWPKFLDANGKGVENVRESDLGDEPGSVEQGIIAVYHY